MTSQIKRTVRMKQSFTSKNKSRENVPTTKKVYGERLRFENIHYSNPMEQIWTINNPVSIILNQYKRSLNRTSTVSALYRQNIGRTSTVSALCSQNPIEVRMSALHSCRLQLNFASLRRISADFNRISALCVEFMLTSIEFCLNLFHSRKIQLKSGVFRFIQGKFNRSQEFFASFKENSIEVGSSTLHSRKIQLKSGVFRFMEGKFNRSRDCYASWRQNSIEVGLNALHTGKIQLNFDCMRFIEARFGWFPAVVYGKKPTNSLATFALRDSHLSQRNITYKYNILNENRQIIIRPSCVTSIISNLYRNQN
jgi:hypothetical protein